MAMFYFSGTGNSRYVAELYCRHMGVECYSIEDEVDFDAILAGHEIVGFCYPVYLSRVPRIMREFVARHKRALKGKKAAIFCTQMLLSGDGARAFADLLPKGHIQVVYAEHFFMPNNFTNLFLLPPTSERQKRKFTACARRKMRRVCRDIKSGVVVKRGFNPVGRALGFIQAPLLPAAERAARRSVKVRGNCTRCRICVSVCPVNNLVLRGDKLLHRRDCTMCYRCVNKCPQKAITVGFHGEVGKQYEM